ncbi:hypothetical protein AS29_004970 [Bacillus sp. SJS]|nr:hypothetical protein AS29_004970 [Bacillus sp. SJS]
MWNRFLYVRVSKSHEWCVSDDREKRRGLIRLFRKRVLISKSGCELFYMHITFVPAMLRSLVRKMDFSIFRINKKSSEQAPESL